MASTKTSSFRSPLIEPVYAVFPFIKQDLRVAYIPIIPVEFLNIFDEISEIWGKLNAREITRAELQTWKDRIQFWSDSFIARSNNRNYLTKDKTSIHFFTKISRITNPCTLDIHTRLSRSSNCSNEEILIETKKLISKYIEAFPQVKIFLKNFPYKPNPYYLRIEPVLLFIPIRGVYEVNFSDLG